MVSRGVERISKRGNFEVQGLTQWFMVVVWERASESVVVSLD